MGDLVRPGKYRDIDGAGVLKAKVDINEAFDLLVKEIKEIKGVDPEFVKQLQNRVGVDGKLTFHEVLFVSFDATLFSEEYDIYHTYHTETRLNENLNIVDVLVDTKNYERTTSSDSVSGAGLIWKEPVGSHLGETRYAIDFDDSRGRPGDRFGYSYAKEELGWESGMFSPRQLASEIWTTDIDKISEFEYVNSRATKYGPSHRLAMDNRAELNKKAKHLLAMLKKARNWDASASFVDKGVFICLLQPVFVYKVAFKGKEYLFYFNAFTKKVLGGIGFRFGVPFAEGYVADNKAAFRLVKLIKLPIIVAAALCAVLWVVYCVVKAEWGVSAYLPPAIFYGAIPVAAMVALYFWAQFYEPRSTLRALIAKNKGDFAKTVIGYLLALVDLFLVAAILIF